MRIETYIAAGLLLAIAIRFSGGASDQSSLPERVDRLYGKLIHSPLESLARQLHRLADFVVDRDLPRTDKDGKDGAGLTLTIFGVVLAQCAALTAYLQGTAAREFELLTVRNSPYVLLAIALIGAIVGIIRATRDSDAPNSTKRAYDKGTVMFSKWVLMWSVSLIILVPILGYFGELPGQFEITSVQQRTFDYTPRGTDKDGINVRIQIGPEHFSDRKVPNEVTIFCFTSRAFHHDWAVVGGQLLDENGKGLRTGAKAYSRDVAPVPKKASGEEDGKEESRPDRKRANRRSYEIDLTGLQSDQRYILDIKLSKQDKSAKSVMRRPTPPEDEQIGRAEAVRRIKDSVGTKTGDFRITLFADS